MDNQLNDILDISYKNQVRHALKELPRCQRAAIILSYFGEMSTYEAAQTMDVTQDAFIRVLVKGEENLHDLLQITERRYG